MAGTKLEEQGGNLHAAKYTVQSIKPAWDTMSSMQKVTIDIQAHFFISYYFIKNYFLYGMKADTRILLMVGLGAVAFFVGLAFHVNLFAAIAIGVLCAFLGVFAVWLIERPRQ